MSNRFVANAFPAPNYDHMVVSEAIERERTRTACWTRCIEYDVADRLLRLCPLNDSGFYSVEVQSDQTVPEEERIPEPYPLQKLGPEPYPLDVPCGTPGVTSES
jgi:hypothetical protein